MTADCKIVVIFLHLTILVKTRDCGLRKKKTSVSMFCRFPCLEHTLIGQNAESLPTKKGPQMKPCSSGSHFSSLNFMHCKEKCRGGRKRLLRKFFPQRHVFLEGKCNSFQLKKLKIWKEKVLAFTNIQALIIKK